MSTHVTTQAPLDHDALRNALEAAGLRSTSQRLAVYDQLAGMLHHPTAEEVFQAVRPSLPRISLATVYKALEALVAINRDRTAKAWRYVTPYQMTTQQHNVPTGAAMTAYMQDETTTPTTTGATFSHVPLVAFPGIAKAIVGNDLLADSAVNLVSFFTRRGGAALGVLEDNEIFKVTSPHDSSVTHGNLCIKGRFGYQHVQNRAR